MTGDRELDIAYTSHLGSGALLRYFFNSILLLLTFIVILSASWSIRFLQMY